MYLSLGFAIDKTSNIVTITLQQATLQYVPLFSATGVATSYTVIPCTPAASYSTVST
jgi:hypothetical protein